MTNLEWVKQELIGKIQNLAADELYELLTDGTIREGICKYCESVFPPCDDTLKDDSICRERFQIICDMEFQEMEREKICLKLQSLCRRYGQ